MNDCEKMRAMSEGCLKFVEAALAVNEEVVNVYESLNFNYCGKELGDFKTKLDSVVLASLKLSVNLITEYFELKESS